MFDPQNPGKKSQSFVFPLTDLYKPAVVFCRWTSLGKAFWLIFIETLWHLLAVAAQSQGILLSIINCHHCFFPSWFNICSSWWCWIKNICCLLQSIIHFEFFLGSHLFVSQTALKLYYSPKRHAETEYACSWTCSSFFTLLISQICCFAFFFWFWGKNESVSRVFGVVDCKNKMFGISDGVILKLE